MAMMYSAPRLSYQACRHRVPCLATGYERGRFDLFFHQFFCMQYRRNFYKIQPSPGGGNVRIALAICIISTTYVAVRYCWPVVSTAQAMRASLLASATTAT
jgi:hypothetical protein